MRPEGLIALLVLGAGSTGLSRCLYLWIIGTAGSVRASLVTYLVPVVGIVLGVVVLGERLGSHALAGSAMIVLGAGLVMYGPQVARPAVRAALKVRSRLPRGLEYLRVAPLRDRDGA
jgi:drug/metabolite transporter (DMT)-like permease